ncbi:MAG: hypothetical protein HYS27_10890 [Deltaproteobacteria bacterium]|nr:hypothetical protein [Deltaproteobacteria bacterium]
MAHPPPFPELVRAAALGCALAAALTGGCLAHGRPVALDDQTTAPAAARGASPIELRESDVELVVQGEPLDAAALDATRAHVARMLTRLHGRPAQGALRAQTRLTITTPRPPLVVTGPYRRYAFEIETELPGMRVVHTAPRTVLADDDGLFALEQWGFLAAGAQGVLSLALAGAGIAIAGDDANQATSWLLFSAAPVAAGAALTAVTAAALSGHAAAHASRRASDALLETLVEHAADVHDDLARRGEQPSAPASAAGASAITLTLHDELACVSRVELERDLEALVPASSSARFLLEATVRAGAKDDAKEQVLVRLVLSRPGSSSALAERELTVARADCGTLARAVARIARMQIEAAAPTDAGGAP